MVRMTIGLVLLIIGGSTADSEIIAIPAIIALLGAWLMLIGSMDVDEEEGE